MRTSYHPVCAVASPDGDGAGELVSGCRLARGVGNPTYNDG